MVNITNTNKAFLFAFNDSSAWGKMSQVVAPELLPIGNRPFLEWVIIKLVDCGFKELYFYASDHANDFFKFLGTGEKWGIRIHFSAVIDEEYAIKRLKYDIKECGGLIVDCNILPTDFSTELLTYEDKNFCCGKSKNDSNLWVYLCRKYVKEIVENNNFKTLQGVVKRISNFSYSVKVDSEILSCKDSEELLNANLILLSSIKYKDYIPGNEVEDSVFLEAGVILHPTAKIDSCTVIGEYSKLGRGSCLYLGTCLGKNCAVGDMTTLKNVIILDNTVLGENLNFENCIVAGNRMIRSGSNNDVIIPDRFMAGEAIDFNLKIIVSYILKYLILLLVSPIAIAVFILLYLLMKLSGIAEPIQVKEAVLLPAGYIPELYKTFFYREFVEKDDKLITCVFKCRILKRLPAFYNLLTNSVDWFGTSEKCIDDVCGMPEDWREIYLKSRVGIFRLIELDNIDSGDNAIDSVVDSYFVINSSFKLKFDVFLRYLKRFFIIDSKHSEK